VSRPHRKSLAGRVAITERWHGADDPRAVDARRKLRAAQLEDHIRCLVDQAPAMTPAQRVRMTALLWGVTDVPA
jgi:hypothetical protein